MSSSRLTSGNGRAYTWRGGAPAWPSDRAPTPPGERGGKGDRCPRAFRCVVDRPPSRLPRRVGPGCPAV